MSDTLKKLALVIYKDILEMERRSGRYLTKGERAEWLTFLITKTLEAHEKDKVYEITMTYDSMMSHWEAYSLTMTGYFEAFKDIDEEEWLK